MIRNFLAANFKGDIKYSHHKFILKIHKVIGILSTVMVVYILFQIHAKCYSLNIRL